MGVGAADLKKGQRVGVGDGDVDGAGAKVGGGWRVGLVFWRAVAVHNNRKKMETLLFYRLCFRR